MSPGARRRFERLKRTMEKTSLPFFGIHFFRPLDLKGLFGVMVFGKICGRNPANGMYNYNPVNNGIFINWVQDFFHQP